MVDKADGSGKERKWVGTGLPEEDMAQYTQLGLTPCVTQVIAGDLVLCEEVPCCVAKPRPIGHGLIGHFAGCRLRIVDTALYHAGCPAEDPSGLR